MKTMTLTLDDDDEKAVQQCIAFLQRLRDHKGSYAIPDGDSCRAGAAIAEACRGYLDLLGEWKG